MWVRYKGPEPRISFDVGTAFSEQGAPPFVDRMQPVEVSDEVGKRVLHTHVEVQKDDGKVHRHSRRNADWEECNPDGSDIDKTTKPSEGADINAMLAPREFVVNERDASEGGAE